MADPLEAFVVEAVLYRLDSPELAAALNGERGDPDSERWQAEVEQSRAQLDELAAMYGRREIGLSEWQAARAPIETRVTDARKRLSRLGRVSALEGHVGNTAGLGERWQTLPLTRQHAIVAAVLDHVIVSPGRRGYNRFDESRLQPVWRTCRGWPARVEHLPRLLRAHRRVEVGEQFPVEALLEDREVRAELARVELGLCCDRRRHGLRP